MSYRLADRIVETMHADYRNGLSLAAVARKYRRHRSSVREMFLKRGLAVRPSPCKMPARLPNGCIAPARPFSAREITALINEATRFSVPLALKVEWRKWPLERRADFIRRMRRKFFHLPCRPNSPLSEGLEFFDYGTPKAWEIAARMNAGRNSRTAAVKIDIRSQGVIWRDELWFWNPKVGYVRGPWDPIKGRPPLHHVIWEETNGRALPESHVIVFLDGKWNNLAPENLGLRTRNELCRQNQAAALKRKAREQTALLLKRSQAPVASTKFRNLEEIHAGKRCY